MKRSIKATSGPLKQGSQALWNVDWFFIQQQLAAETAPRRSNQQLMHYLWPQSQRYHSPLNPVFLANGYTPREMAKQPLWLARDGLVPLLWFFRQNPEPGPFSGTLFVPETSAVFTPAAWRKQVSTYEVVSAPLKRRRPVDRIFITAMISQSYNSLEHIESAMDRAVAVIGEKKFRQLPKELFLMEKTFDSLAEQRYGFYPEALKQIYRRTGLEKLSNIEWRELDGKASFEGHLFLDLNPGLICADGILTHKILGRGAQLLELAGRIPEEEFIRLSPFHGMHVRPLTGAVRPSRFWLDWAQESSIVRTAEKVLRTPSNLDFPWPKWFADYAKAAAKDLTAL